MISLVDWQSWAAWVFPAVAAVVVLPGVVAPAWLARAQAGRPELPEVEKPGVGP